MLPSAKRLITTVSSLAVNRLASSCCSHPPLKPQTSEKRSHRHASSASPENAEGTDENATEVPGMAFNYIVKKKFLQRPTHTIEEQVKYMQSQGTRQRIIKIITLRGAFLISMRCLCSTPRWALVFANAYKGLPIYKWYRRNVAGQMMYQPPPRLFCVSKDGRYNTNNPCPVCRDEYLWFDYRVRRTPNVRRSSCLLEPTAHRDVLDARHGSAHRATEVGAMPRTVQHAQSSTAQGQGAWHVLAA